MPNLDRRSYDTGASGEAQANLAGVVSRLEALLNQRDADVKSAMADFQADGVSDDYHAKEMRWYKAGHEVRQIIALVKTTMERNDGTAHDTLSHARAAVDSIG